MNSFGSENYGIYIFSKPPMNIGMRNALFQETYQLIK